MSAMICASVRFAPACFCKKTENASSCADRKRRQLFFFSSKSSLTTATLNSFKSSWLSLFESSWLKALFSCCSVSAVQEWNSLNIHILSGVVLSHQLNRPKKPYTRLLSAAMWIGIERPKALTSSSSVLSLKQSGNTCAKIRIFVLSSVQFVLEWKLSHSGFSQCLELHKLHNGLIWFAHPSLITIKCFWLSCQRPLGTRTSSDICGSFRLFLPSWHSR